MSLCDLGNSNMYRDSPPFYENPLGKIEVYKHILRIRYVVLFVRKQVDPCLLRLSETFIHHRHLNAACMLGHAGACAYIRAPTHTHTHRGAHSGNTHIFEYIHIIKQTRRWADKYWISKAPACACTCNIYFDKASKSHMYAEKGWSGIAAHTSVAMAGKHWETRAACCVYGTLSCGMLPGTGTVIPCGSVRGREGSYWDVVPLGCRDRLS